MEYKKLITLLGIALGLALAMFFALGIIRKVQEAFAVDKTVGFVSLIVAILLILYIGNNVRK